MEFEPVRLTNITLFYMFSLQVQRKYIYLFDKMVILPSNVRNTLFIYIPTYFILLAKTHDFTKLCRSHKFDEIYINPNQ